MELQENHLNRSKISEPESYHVTARSTVQHSARSKAGARNVCQDSLIQMCLVSKMKINLANGCGMLLQRYVRAITWCRTEYTTLPL